MTTYETAFLLNAVHPHKKVGSPATSINDLLRRGTTAVTGRPQLTLISKPALSAAPVHGLVRRGLDLHAEQTQEPRPCARDNEQ